MRDEGRKKIVCSRDSYVVDDCKLGAKERPAAQMQIFGGAIMDTLCTPYGSHEHMMQQLKSMGSDKKSCIKQCLVLGAKYPLYDEAKRSYYRIDDQAKEKVEPFAGQRVQISGTVDKKAIKVTDMKAE